MRGDARWRWAFALLAAATTALFLAGLGRLPLFGRDEALYAEAGREMLASGDWITPRVNALPFLEKPPLYYWLAGLCYRAVGVSPFGARLPAALMAILTVLLTARIGARAWGPRAGMLAGLALAASLQMAMIGRMGIMDAPLTCLTVLALLAYERWRDRGSLAGASAFGVCLGAAALLKGAAGLVPLAVAVAHALIWRPRHGAGRSLPTRSAARAALAVVAFLVVAAPWFIAMNARHGSAFGATLFLREHVRRVLQPMQGHGGPLWFYLPIILVGFFPWVMFALPGARREAHESEKRAFWRSLAVVWTLVVLVPFSVVSTKLPGYVTPLFPALALLAGADLSGRWEQPRRAPWVAALVAAALLAALVLVLPAAGARIGERVGAAREARLLVGPAAAWAAGYLVVAAGAVLGLTGRMRSGLAMTAAGQAVCLLSLLAGVLPVLSPYLGGASATLALRAEKELPGRQIVLYETNPETVNFVLRRAVPTYDDDQKEQLLAHVQEMPTALIAPLGEEAFWRTLPARRRWREGDRVLLDVSAQDRPKRKTTDPGHQRQ